MQCVGFTAKPALKEQKGAGKDATAAIKGERRAWLPRQREFVTVPVFDAQRLRRGNRIEGPAILEQVNTTTFVTPEYVVRVDRLGSFAILLRDREDELAGRVAP